MVSLLPSAGFGLQVSIVDMRGAFIEGTDRQSRSDVHGSVFASLLGRFMFHRIVGLVIELGLDILLNYERFEVGPGDGGEEIFDYGRVGLFGRVGVVFGL